MPDSHSMVDRSQEPEKRFLDMVQDSPLAVYIWRLEPDGRLVFAGANPAADRALDIDSRRFAGMTLEQAFPTVLGTDIPAGFRHVPGNGLAMPGVGM